MKQVAHTWALHRWTAIAVFVTAAVILPSAAFAGSGVSAPVDRILRGRASVGGISGVMPASRNANVEGLRPFAAPRLEYGGGAVQHTNTVYAIFWAPPGFAFPPGYTDLVSQYLTDVAHDNYTASNAYAVPTQYYDVVGGRKQFISYSVNFGGAIFASDALPDIGCANYVLTDGTTSAGCITNAQIRTEVRSVIAARHLPKGQATDYLLFTPPGLGNCFALTGRGGCYAAHVDPSHDTYCAYHSWTDSSPSAVLYANLPYQALPGCDGEQPNGNPADPALDTLSHEHNEMITDPVGTGWRSADGREIADLCPLYGPPIGTTAFGRYNQVINGHDYWTQEEWSNRATACVQRNTFPQPTASFTFSPFRPIRGETVKFIATAHENADTIFTYRWTFPGGSVSTSSNPVFAFPSAGIAKVILIVYDPNGNQARVVRKFRVK